MGWTDLAFAGRLAGTDPSDLEEHRQFEQFGRYLPRNPSNLPHNPITYSAYLIALYHRT